MKWHITGSSAQQAGKVRCSGRHPQFRGEKRHKQMTPLEENATPPAIVIVMLIALKLLQISRKL